MKLQDFTKEFEIRSMDTVARGMLSNQACVSYASDYIFAFLANKGQKFENVYGKKIETTKISVRFNQPAKHQQVVTVRTESLEITNDTVILCLAVEVEGKSIANINYHLRFVYNGEYFLINDEIKQLFVN